LTNSEIHVRKFIFATFNTPKRAIKAASCLLFLCGALVAPASVATNNYYVSPTGSDSNNGLSPSTAWKTITHASNAITLGSTGTIVHVAPGTYSENVAISNAVPGTSSAPVTYISDTKWAASIQPPSASSPGIYNNAAYSIIENFDVGGSECTGIQQDNTNQTAIGNNVHNSAQGCDNSGGGGGIVDSNWAATGNSQYANFVHDIGMVNASCVNRTNGTIQGIYHEHPGGTVANNLVVNVCDTGIVLWHAASSTLIVNNTVVHNSVGIYVGSGDAPCSTTGCSGDTNTLVINNVAVDNTNYGIGEGASDGGRMGTVSYQNNLTFGNSEDYGGSGVACTKCITGKDPLFANNTGTAFGNYAVLSGSPAIGAGTSTDAPATDYAGITRTPPITEGAYQFNDPSSSGTGTPTGDPSPIAYWTLDDDRGSAAADSSGNGHIMTLANSPTWEASTNCKATGCLGFNGSNQYGTASLDLSSTKVITITFWMKWNAYANDNKLAFEFSSNFNNSTTGFIIDPDESSSGQFWVSVHGNAGYNNAAFPRPSAGVWHHYAFVLNKGAATGSQVIPYVDGKPVSYTKSAYAAENTNNFGVNQLFVMSRGGSSLFGAGSLEQIRIYPTALSPSEIAALATP